MTVQQWSTTAADNNSSPPTGAPEGMAAAAVNNTMREMMASVAIEAQVNRVKYLNSVAGTNTITGSMTPALTAYSAGMIVVFTPANNNTGATTININSLGALDVQKFDGDALISGDLVAGVPAFLVLDSGADDWILLNPQSLALPGNVSVTGNITASGTINATGAVNGDNLDVAAASSGLALTMGSANVVVRVSTGSPNGVFNDPIGSLFLRTDGGLSTTLYVKEQSGSSGWTAK